MKKCIIRFDETHTYEVSLDGDEVSIAKIQNASDGTKTTKTTRKTTVKKGE